MTVNLTTTRALAQSSGINILVYGQAGVGKTTLIKTLPGKPIIISAEAGLLSLSDVDIPVIVVHTLQDVINAYTFLQSPEGRQYDSVALDSISEIAEVVLANEKSNFKDARKAYGEMQDKMAAMIRSFRDLDGRNVYMVAKQGHVNEGGNGLLKYYPMFPGQRLSQEAAFWFDEVLCLRVINDAEGNVIRYLQTQPCFQYTAKDRSGKLDPEGEYPDLGHIINKIKGGGAPPPTHEPQKDDFLANGFEDLPY
ncbi:AAA family ATPase [Oligella urethralis]|uniref:ATP-binding protein n=1 Tax=Oligella urethralis TaxID=90245 RepID=UPI000D00D403|nr:ATP-binding protein [Oligella urethralis]AVL70843.1 AAA family ATPase [Oligella urethralis]